MDYQTFSYHFPDIRCGFPKIGLPPVIIRFLFGILPNKINPHGNQTATAQGALTARGVRMPAAGATPGKWIKHAAI